MIPIGLGPLFLIIILAWLVIADHILFFLGRRK